MRMRENPLDCWGRRRSRSPLSPAPASSVRGSAQRGGNRVQQRDLPAQELGLNVQAQAEPGLQGGNADSRGANIESDPLQLLSHFPGARSDRRSASLGVDQSLVLAPGQSGSSLQLHLPNQSVTADAPSKFELSHLANATKHPGWSDRLYDLVSPCGHAALCYATTKLPALLTVPAGAELLLTVTSPVLAPAGTTAFRVVGET